MRLIVSLLALCSLFAANPQLANVKSVYLLPMANGMDQYLANHLRAAGNYVVVTDPQAADAVFTDSVGPVFERKLAELYPPKEVEEDEEKAEKEQFPVSTFRRGRGVVFLVERKSRQVVWSTYEKPRDVRADSVNQAAQRIAQRLNKELTGAK